LEILEERTASIFVMTDTFKQLYATNAFSSSVLTLQAAEKNFTSQKEAVHSSNRRKCKHHHTTLTPKTKPSRIAFFSGNLIGEIRSTNYYKTW
jgi:hypothetical protein